jgi:hypothetical protein
MHSTAEFDDESTPETTGKPQESPVDRGDLRLARRFFEDTPKPNIAGNELPSVEKSAAQNPATVFDEKITAIGAKVKTDKQDHLVRELERSDDSKITDVKYDANKKLESFTSIGADKNKIFYKRDGETDGYKAFTAEGKALPQLGIISKVELNTNGNLNFLDQAGKQVIVRGNGGTIPIGAMGVDVQFDSEGRTTKTTPSAEAIKNGAVIRTVTAYKGNTEEPIEVKEECPALSPGLVFTEKVDDATQKWERKDQNGQPYNCSQGKRAFTKELAYVHKDTIQVDGNAKEFTRVEHLNGAEEIQDTYIQPDGYHIVRNYNENGKFIGVQAFAPKVGPDGKIIRDKEGKIVPGMPGKKYMAGLRNGQPRILEFEPLTRTMIAWDQQSAVGKTEKGLKFSGEVLSSGPKSHLKVGQKLEPRYNLDFKEDGNIAYKDEKNVAHTEFKDRSQSMLRPDGSVLVVDQRGYPYRVMKDKDNYLQYDWKDNGKGARELARVKSVVNGLMSDAWTPFGKPYVVQTDGRFSYEDKDGKAVFIDLDSTVTKYQIGKDAKGPILTPVEVILPNEGGTRSIKFGADIEHPERIDDLFTDAAGRVVTRTLEAVKVATPGRALAAHNQRMQTYKLTEKILGGGNFTQKKAGSMITMQGTLTDVEILNNGDFRGTAPMNAANPFQPFSGLRYEFKAKHMAETIVPREGAPPPQSMKPLDADTRLALAKERFDKVFSQDVIPTLQARADGKDHMSDDFLTEYLLLPRVNMAADAQQNAMALAKYKNDAAYRYELGYAIFSQRKIDAAGRKE